MDEFLLDPGQIGGGMREFGEHGEIGRIGNASTSKREVSEPIDEGIIDLSLSETRYPVGI